MNTKRVTLVLLALLAMLLLSSCTGTGAARGASWPGLAADAETAYLSDGAQLFAVRLSDGAQVWKYPAKADAKVAFYATPALVEDGRLVIGSAGTDQCLYVIDTTKIDAATQSPAATCVFKGPKDHWIAGPLVVGDVIYAPNSDGTLYAVSLTDNSLLWSLKLGGGGHLWAAPVSDGKTLYVASLDHFIYAVDIASHELVWKTDLGGSVPSGPAISADGKTLFAGSFASKVFALDAASGSVLWETATQGWTWGSPVVSEETVYVGDLEGQLYALNAADGAIAWSAQPDGPITGSPLLSGDLVVVTTETGKVFAYSRDTHAQQASWPYSIEKGKIYTAAVQGGDRILVAPLSSGVEFLMTALNTSGSVVWNFKPQ